MISTKTVRLALAAATALREPRTYVAEGGCFS